MAIKIEPAVELQAFCACHKLSLELHRRTDDIVRGGAHRYYISPRPLLEAVGGGVLRSISGNGDTFKEAAKDLANELSGIRFIKGMVRAVEYDAPRKVIVRNMKGITR